ncbi:hypothetical protein [Micromonospora sp. WMMD998]|uniref:hypothetical protein n=1 Tax=Micromonospora sp. WMMD998 TaxID=3016092 RepID=UPI00249B0D67|nr:hypothetical protein [Micromonospora sp. WMMD998]WFE38635.1 hypothetical protein O7619_09425 [Micromonospora sp. WMMD998]
MPRPRMATSLARRSATPTALLFAVLAILAAVLLTPVGYRSAVAAGPAEDAAPAGPEPSGPVPNRAAVHLARGVLLGGGVAFVGHYLARRLTARRDSS